MLAWRKPQRPDKHNPNQTAPDAMLAWRRWKPPVTCFVKRRCAPVLPPSKNVTDCTNCYICYAGSSSNVPDRIETNFYADFFANNQPNTIDREFLAKPNNTLTLYGDGNAYLTLKKSSVEEIGLGLFAAKSLEKGTIIGTYIGVVYEQFNDTIEPLKKKHISTAKTEQSSEILPDFDKMSKIAAKTFPDLDYSITLSHMFKRKQTFNYFRNQQTVRWSAEETLGPEKIVGCESNSAYNLMHFINDPRGSKHKPNVKVTQNGVVRTSKYVARNQELFWNYGIEYWDQS